MVSAAKTTVPISGAECGINVANDGDHGPERKTKFIFLNFMSAVKRGMIEGDSSISPFEELSRSSVEKSLYLVYAAQVKIMFGSVTRRRTASL